MLVEKRNFLQGLNGDVSQRLLGDGEMLNLMNARMAVTEFGRLGRIENIPGTTLISQSVYPPYGTHQCIGSTVDNARRRIIYALWNSVGDHGIYAYDLEELTTYAILYDSQVIDGLGFSKTSRIDRDMVVVGDLLYWTDNLNEPRRINIEAGIKMNHASYVTDVTPYSWPMNQSVISIIRRPFGLPVSVTKVTDGSFTENFIKDFSGQLASVLVYRDGEESVVSVPSEMVHYNYPADTFNAIDVEFDTAEDFDQDVQTIQLLVRFDNNQNYFKIKEWGRSVPSELAEIEAHNAGTTPLTFRFYNDKSGVAIGEFKSTKDADNIGLTWKTLSFADSRLFGANYPKGYDTPKTNSFEEYVFTIGSGDLTTQRIFRPNSKYQLAIQFRDYNKRRCSVITSDSLAISIPDRNYAYTSYVKELTWTLTNSNALIDIPDWAYYYDILITKNLSTRFFVEMLVLPRYAKRLQDGTFTYVDTYDSSIFGVAINIAAWYNEGLGYIFSEGDFCRLYLDATPTVYEFPVIAQDGNYVILSPFNIGDFTIQSQGAYGQIFTPYKQLLNEAFYTTGNSYTITNPTTSSRSYSTLIGTIAGDSYRTIGAALPLKFTTMSPNIQIDWRAWYNIFGESNIELDIGQVVKDNFIQWSNTKIEGSQINGLSTFDALDEKPIPDELGEINKLQLATKMSDLGQGDIMLALTPTEACSLYLGETQLMAAARQGDVATTTSVIGSINVLKGSSGTINKESVQEYLGLVFWFDAINGFFTQYSINGLEFVSRYKMSRFFKNYAKDYLDASTNNLDNINGFHHIATGVDPYHKEILVGLPGLIYENYADTLPSFSSVPSYATSIIDRFDIYDQLQKTMAFKFEDNYWGSNFEYGAEWFENIDNQLFGWEDGYLYSHNTDTVNWNRFYGTQYPVRLCFTGNLNPSMLKDLFNIAIEGTDIPNFTVAMANVPNIQITDLSSTDTDIDGELIWQNQEGVLYATFLMDRLSPNASGTAEEKLFTGDLLKDFALFFHLEFQAYTNLIYINFVNIGYQVSKGQKQILNIVNP